MWPEKVRQDRPPESFGDHSCEQRTALRSYFSLLRSHRWKQSSSGYPATMLAAWMALERRSFSPADLPDFIVTVNKGIEPTDC